MAPTLNTHARTTHTKAVCKAAERCRRRRRRCAPTPDADGGGDGSGCARESARALEIWAVAATAALCLWAPDCIYGSRATARV